MSSLCKCDSFLQLVARLQHQQDLTVGTVPLERHPRLPPVGPPLELCGGHGTGHALATDPP